MSNEVSQKCQACWRHQQTINYTNNAIWKYLEAIMSIFQSFKGVTMKILLIDLSPLFKPFFSIIPASVWITNDYTNFEV